MGKWRETPPSGIEATRALLDQLMGANRNNDRPDSEVKDFRDDRVCKFYLCGLCPYDIFTKDIGRCPKMHSDQLKKDYEEKRVTGRSYGYEKILEDELRAYVNDIEKKIQKAQKRLEESGEGATSSVNLENHSEVLKLQAKIQELVQEAELAAENGDIDRAQELTDEIEKLKLEKTQLQAKLMSESNGANPIDRNTPLTNVNQKLRVCDVCGCLLSIFDSDRRLADHFGGKQHMGYKQVRDKLKEIEEMKEKERAIKLTTTTTTTITTTITQEKSKSRSLSISRTKQKKRDSRRSRSNSRSSSRKASRHDRKKRNRSRSRRRSRSRSGPRRHHRHRHESRSQSRSGNNRHESETKTNSSNYSNQSRSNSIP